MPLQKTNRGNAVALSESSQGWSCKGRDGSGVSHVGRDVGHQAVEFVGLANERLRAEGVARGDGAERGAQTLAQTGRAGVRVAQPADQPLAVGAALTLRVEPRRLVAATVRNVAPRLQLQDVPHQVVQDRLDGVRVRAAAHVAAESRRLGI